MSQKTIPQDAISGQTFCANCDEAICICVIIYPTGAQRYAVINSEPYKVQA